MHYLIGMVNESADAQSCVSFFVNKKDIVDIDIPSLVQVRNPMAMLTPSKL